MSDLESKPWPFASTRLCQDVRLSIQRLFHTVREYRDQEAEGPPQSGPKVNIDFFQMQKRHGSTKMSPSSSQNYSALSGISLRVEKDVRSGIRTFAVRVRVHYRHCPSWHLPGCRGLSKRREVQNLTASGLFERGFKSGGEAGTGENGRLVTEGEFKTTKRF